MILEVLLLQPAKMYGDNLLSFVVGDYGYTYSEEDEEGWDFAFWGKGWVPDDYHLRLNNGETWKLQYIEVWDATPSPFYFSTDLEVIFVSSVAPKEFWWYEEEEFLYHNVVNVTAVSSDEVYIFGGNIFGGVNSSFNNGVYNVLHNSVNIYDVSIAFIASFVPDSDHYGEDVPNDYLGVGSSVMGGFNTVHGSGYNSVNITNSELTISKYTPYKNPNIPKIYGGVSAIGHATYNKIGIYDSKIIGPELYGGAVFQENGTERIYGVHHNEIIIEDSYIGGGPEFNTNIYGGFIYRNNTGYKEDEKKFTDIIDNKIHIKGNKTLFGGLSGHAGVNNLCGADVAYRNIFGKYVEVKTADMFSGNTLILERSKNLEVGNLRNFQYFEFTIPANFKTGLDGDYMLRVTNSSRLQEYRQGGRSSEITQLNIDQAHPRLKLNDQIVLIDTTGPNLFMRDEILNRQFSVKHPEDAYGRAGDLEYKFQIKRIDNKIVAQVIEIETLPPSTLRFEDSSMYDIPEMTVNVPIKPVDVSVGVSGGVPPYTFSASGLPPDVSIDSGTGVISGTPDVTPFRGSATITVTDTEPKSARITISYGAPLKFEDSSAYDIPEMTAYVSIKPVDVSVGVSGGVPPYTFSASGLPYGVSIDSGTGVISGTPLISSLWRDATITVTDTEPKSASITISYSIKDEPEPDEPGGSNGCNFGSNILPFIFFLITALLQHVRKRPKDKNN
ncbi:MAG: Ig domain-containing protein [Synergistaceae bacterium]|nr:Ig domain-containing protein [Synergistaceae bacterium]